MAEDALWTEYFRKGLPGKYPPFKQTLEGTGAKVVYCAETATGEKMFLPILDIIASKKADYFFNLNAYSDAVIFAKQWAQSAAADIDLYNNGGASTMPAFWGTTGGAALGVVCSSYAAKARLTERTVPLIEALKAAYNKEPNWVSYSCYDVIHLMKAASEKSKSADVEALIKSLETIEIAGV